MSEIMTKNALVRRAIHPTGNAFHLSVSQLFCSAHPHGIAVRSDSHCPALWFGSCHTWCASRSSFFFLPFLWQGPAFLKLHFYWVLEAAQYAGGGQGILWERKIYGVFSISD